MQIIRDMMMEEEEEERQRRQQQRRPALSRREWFAHQPDSYFLEEIVGEEYSKWMAGWW